MAPMEWATSELVVCPTLLVCSTRVLANILRSHHAPGLLAVSGIILSLSSSVISFVRHEETAWRNRD